MRIWIKAVLALLTIALLLWLVVRIGAFTLDVLSAYGGGSAGRDPQFAQEAETVAPSPLTEEAVPAVEFKDNSANWDTSVKTPVDQTAAELEAEARSGK